MLNISYLSPYVVVSLDFLCLHPARPDWQAEALCSSFIYTFVRLLPNFWTRYFENELKPILKWIGSSGRRCEGMQWSRFCLVKNASFAACEEHLWITDTVHSSEAVQARVHVFQQDRQLCFVSARRTRHEAVLTQRSVEVIHCYLRS